MSLEILTAGDTGDWSRLFNMLPEDERDIYFTPEYWRVQESLGGEAMLAVLITEGGFVMQPFLRRPLEKGLSDLGNGYGFGGPMSNIPAGEWRQKAGAMFWEQLQAWADGAGVVSEFTQLHPMFNARQRELIPNHQMFTTKPVVVVDLHKTTRCTVSRRIRRGYDKAVGTGAFCSMVPVGPQDAFNFAAEYNLTMERKKAPDRLRFKLDYIAQLFSELNAMLFTAVGSGGMRQLMVLGKGPGTTAYAHLLSSNGLATQNGLDELLYGTACQELTVQRGFKYFHLGGGRTDKADDPLLAFKMGFSNTLYAADRYARIFNPVNYTNLVNMKKATEISEHGRESTADFFPGYRRDFT